MLCYLSTIDQLFGSAAVIQTIAIVIHAKYEDDMLNLAHTGRLYIPHDQRTVIEVYNCLGPRYFHHAYRMTFDSFYVFMPFFPLILWPRLKNNVNECKKVGRRAGGNYVLPPMRNGPISSSVRLACTIRYFAGGSSNDIVVMFGISYEAILVNVWIIVEAINNTLDFQITYPKSLDAQRKIAAGFEKASTPKINNCAGAIDGFLIWILKPSTSEVKEFSIGQKKFLIFQSFMVA